MFRSMRKSFFFAVTFNVHWASFEFLGLWILTETFGCLCLRHLFHNGSKYLGSFLDSISIIFCLHSRTATKGKACFSCSRREKKVKSLMKSYLAKLRMKQWSHAQPMTERTRKTHSQSPWFKNTQITQTGRDSKQHLGLVHFPTVPGARGGNASVDPAPPAAASSSPSSSRFSSSPGARIFLTRTRFKDLEPDTKEMTHSSNSDAWKSLHQYLFIYTFKHTCYWNLY